MAKLRKPFILGLVFIGIVLSLLNFIPGIQAGSLFGTTTNLDDPELLWWYFVTICMKNFKCWFGEIKNGKIIVNNLGRIVEEEWLKTKDIRENVDLDYYVIMQTIFMVS